MILGRCIRRYIRRYTTSPKPTFFLGQVRIDPPVKEGVKRSKIAINNTPQPNVGWYTILTRTLADEDAEHRIQKWKNQIFQDLESDHLVGNFGRCYRNQMVQYGEKRLNLSLSNVRLPPYLYDAPKSVQVARQRNIMAKYVANRLTNGSFNQKVLNKRHNLKRSVPEFYLHQQFTINLSKGDVGRLIDIYFELPGRRPLYLTSYELEKLLSLVLRYKMAEEDHLFNAEKLCLFFEDLMDKRIPLTVFEQTKYVLFKMKLLLEVQKLDRKTSLDSLLELSNRFAFGPPIWHLLLDSFPEYKEALLKYMSTRTPLDRQLVMNLCSKTTNLGELVNVLELAALKRMHIDRAFLEVVIHKLAVVDYPVAKEIIGKLQDTIPLGDVRRNGNEMTRIHTIQVERNMNMRFEALNVLYLLHSRNNGSHAKEIVRYAFLPTPMVYADMIDQSLKNESELHSLLDSMAHWQYPLINMSANKIVKSLLDTGSTDMALLQKVVKMAYDAMNYNEYLYMCANKPQFDKRRLKQYAPVDPVASMTELLRNSSEVYQRQGNTEAQKALVELYNVVKQANR